jgi:hypothetical protein
LTSTTGYSVAGITNKFSRHHRNGLSSRSCTIVQFQNSGETKFENVNVSFSSSGDADVVYTEAQKPT